MRKTLYTLNLNPEQYGDITELTYPWLKHHAIKCGAEFHEITERKFLEWPPTYEKFQVYDLAKQRGDDWSIFIDCDALIHPNAPDMTSHLPRDTTLHYGADPSNARFVPDRFFYRDGRNIGSASWFCVASDWCRELFEPLPDLTPDDVSKMIFPIADELKRGVTPIRLVDDFVMSRNIAKYGLKFITTKEMFAKWNMDKLALHFHLYAIPHERKVEEIRKVAMAWGLI